MDGHWSGGGCSMADVLLDDVSRVFKDGSKAVSHLSLHVRNAELMVIVGPSGCGKSTVLRLIAGLDPLDGGTISIGGRVVNRLPPGERNVAMVFEAAALYPHLTTAQNLRFALSLRKLPDERIRLRTELAQLQHGLGVTAVYVTHDQAQAMAIGDRVAVMRAGRIEQVDEPLKLYRRPANVFVASFMGEPA